MLPCVAQTGVVSPVGGDQAPGITRGVSFRVRGQSSPHRAKQRLSAGRARDHPVMEIVPNKARLSKDLLYGTVALVTKLQPGPGAPSRG